MIEQVKKYLVHLQESICSDLELLDGRAIFVFKVEVERSRF